MSDNVQASDVSGSSGPTFASDQIGTTHYPICKLAFGILDTATLASSTNPFPVTFVSGATSIAKAEDVASADADVGVPAMAVRKLAPANTSGTDGDYEMLQMSAGRLWVSATIDAALPAGTNAIGKLAANSGVTIGAVEIAAAQTLATVSTVSTVTNVATIGTSITPGTSAAHLGKAEDAVHSSGDTGVFVLAVRNNTASALAGSDGDYIPLTTNTTGHLWVDASGQTLTVGSHNVTNAGTFAVQATIASGATSIAKAEDAASADADVGVGCLAVRKASPANTSGTDGDYEFLQISAGRLWCSATIDAALPAGANAIGKLAANSGVTIGAVEIAAAQTLATVTTVSTVTNVATIGTSVTPGTAAANLGKAEDAAHTTGDTGVMLLAVRQSTATDLSAGATNGDYEPLQVDANGRLWGVVNVDQMNGVAVSMGNGVSGTGVQRVTLASDSTGTLAGVTTLTGGGVAHDGVDSGNPHKVGARCALTLSNDTMVSDGDRADNVADADGAQIVRQQFPLGDLLSERVTDTTGNSTAFTNFSAVGSTRNYVTAIVVYNSSATAGYIDFRDGTAGAVLYTVPIPAGGGCTLSAGGTPLFRSSAATALAFDVSAALTTVYISLSGYQSKC